MEHDKKDLYRLSKAFTFQQTSLHDGLIEKSTTKQVPRPHGTQSINIVFLEFQIK